MTKTGERRSIKFGWTANLMDGLRCFSPLPYYVISDDPHPQLNDKELKRKFEDALKEDGDYEGHLYLGFIENAAIDHDRKKLTAAKSAALTRHAEATCIADCPDKELLITGREERGSIQYDGPTYKMYDDRIIADHAHKRYLRFDRKQFNKLIRLVREHPLFQSQVKQIKTNVKNQKRDSICLLLIKSHLLNYRKRTSEFLDTLSEFQGENDTAFEHLMTIKNNLLPKSK